MRRRRADAAATRLAVAALRNPGLAWAALALALVGAAAALPGLRLEFGFKDIFAPGNPARSAFEEHERDFELGPRLYVYVAGEDLYAPGMLAELDGLIGGLSRTRGVESIRSPMDLVVPETRGNQVRLVRCLRPEVREDPGALARMLATPALTEDWKGFLYDGDRRVFALVIDLEDDGGDPTRSVGLMAALRAVLDEFAATHDVRVYLNGMFYLNHEVLRVTFENQGRLTSLSLGLVLVMMWILFGSLPYAAAVLGMLGVSAVLAFGGMALLGIPMNGMSGNLPLMIVVIGLADVVHVTAAWCRRRGRGPAAAAALAAGRTAVPNFLTTLTTFGCLAVMTHTELQVLSHFAGALGLGIFVVYAVTIAYAPLCLAVMGPRPGRGLYFHLQVRLERALEGRWSEVIRARGTLVAFGVAGAILLAISSTQRLNSNWFRYFAADLPVSRSLDFLAGHGFPVTTLELRIPVEGTPSQHLADPALETDVRALHDALSRGPGVMGVYSLFTTKAHLDAAWRGLVFPESLAPRWRQARREGVERQLVHQGITDEYVSLRTRDLRVVITTTAEDSRSLLALSRWILARVGELPLTKIQPDTVRVSGLMLYWSAIMEGVSRAFFEGLVGSLLVVFLCFLVVTRSVGLGLLALVPNVLPVLAMFTASAALGYDLSENFCLLVSLSIGIAVDDTLHYLHHYGAARAGGRDVAAAALHALRVVGAPLVITSGILILGFSVCLLGTIVPTILTGVFLAVSITTALLADLLLVPAVLLRAAGDEGPPDANGAPP